MNKQKNTVLLAGDESKLREALAAGPTQGTWHHAPHFGEWQISSNYSVDGEARGTGRQLVAYSPRANKRTTPAYAAMFEANGRFIAEANPERITRLLDELQRLRAELARERFARQEAQRDTEAARQERNAARLQGERDARRTLQYAIHRALEAERQACIDLVARHGGSVEIEAAIRARGNP